MSIATTQDEFLGGRLTIRQPARGYRAGVDAVLLAAAVPARGGDAVLELGCGVGTAALCLVARVAGVSLVGVEVQPDYADLARRNAGDAMQVVEADLRALPPDLRNRQFDHVMMNPPYFRREAGTSSDDVGRDTALAGETPLADWLDVGLRRLRPKGSLTVIQRIERLPDVLAGLDDRVGSIVVKPIMGRIGAPPSRFLLQARHSGRAAFKMSAPLVMHEGTHHAADAESYSPLVRQVLRDAAGLPMSN